MNLESINTVSDLVNQNEEVTAIQGAIEAMEKCDYEDTRLVTIWLINNMLEFHMNQANVCNKDPEQGNALSWSHDAGKLEIMLETLKGIE